MTAMIGDQKQVLLAAVERIRPEVERSADDGESLMTLPAGTVRALAESGLFSIKLPAVLGGMEADLVTQYEVIEAMAYIDASAGWCLMIGATSTAILGAYLPEDAVAEVFADHRIPLAATSVIPTGSATPRDGGYRLTGRWRFASGVRHSEWLSVGALVPDEHSDTPQLRMFVLPTSKARIHDNWDTIGLRGTGSCDLTLEDVFVPTSFSCGIFSGEPARGGPLYRLGLPAFVAYEHAAFAIGVARRAIDTIIELAPSKARGVPPTALAERATFQRDLGELHLRLQAARALVLERNRAAWECVTSGQRPDVRLQTELRGVVALATDVALDVVTRIYRFAGGGAVYRPNRLERSVRDLHTAGQHLMVSGSVYEAYGEILLGMADVNPLS
jgi:alkylation response protein AidB-like acyl-CoA dehydrogenase